jgi:hypothetical protein
MTLAELREEVEKATGPDRELDALIVVELEGWTFQKFKGDSRPYWRTPKNSNQESWFMRENNGPPLYTASIEAAIALIEKMLTGENWQITSGATAIGSGPFVMHYSARVFGETGDNPAYDKPTPALALCSALLAALIAKEA